MNKKIYLMAFLCAVFLCLVSCELDDVKSQQIMNGYFTITGSSPNYKLIADNGTIVYPTSSSVSDITKGFGFGNHKRDYFKHLLQQREYDNRERNHYNSQCRITEGDISNRDEDHLRRRSYQGRNNARRQHFPYQYSWQLLVVKRLPHILIRSKLFYNKRHYC